MLLYITGNQHKVQTANDHLKPFGITVRGMEVDGIIEPQLEDVTEISTSKAKQAFEHVQKPLIVSDSGWMITALNGFPGPYMASVNRWFTPQDFLNLMQDKKNKEIVLRECVAYADKDQLKTFVRDSTGTFLEEASGDGTPLEEVVTFRKNGKSIANCENEGILRIPQNELWDDVGRWLRDEGGLG